MKNLLKLFLVLALCCAVFCQGQNDFSIDIDAVSVSVSESLVPFFKVIHENEVYYLRLLSIYEIQQQNDSLWYRTPGTETLFDSLNWNITSNLTGGTFTLMGSACPCEGLPQPQEPVFDRRSHLGKREIYDEGDSGYPLFNTGCPVINFEYIKLVFSLDPNCLSTGNQGTDGGNNGGNNGANDCNSTCVDACSNADNTTSCVSYCGNFIDVTYINETICNSTCLVDGVADPDCLVACNAFSTCLSSTTPPTPSTPNVCTLTLNYVLYNYQWSNISAGSNATKLAFAFEVVPEAANVPCRTYFDNWYQGPFNVQLNVSSYATQGNDFTDISNATPVESNLVWTMRDDVIVGRIYLEQFDSGNSIFNPLASIQPNQTDGGNNGGNSKRGIPYSFPI